MGQNTHKIHVFFHQLLNFNIYLNTKSVIKYHKTIIPFCFCTLKQIVTHKHHVCKDKTTRYVFNWQHQQFNAQTQHTLHM